MMAIGILPWFLVLFGQFGLFAPVVPTTPEQAKARHELLASQLQAGGDVYTLKSSEGRLEGMVAMVGEMVKAGGEEPAAIFAQVDQLLREQGMYSLLGIGYSSVPRGDGLKDTRLFLAREAEAAKLGAWRSLLGGEASERSLLAFVPKDAALLLGITPDPAAIWSLWSHINLTLANHGDAEAAARAVDQLQARLGADPAALLASLDGELVVSLQLATDGSTVAIPMGRQNMTMPQPSLLLMAKVKDNRLQEFLLGKLQADGVALASTDVQGVQMLSRPAPLAAPLPLQPAMARQGDTLIFGTTPAVVAAAVHAARQGDGLVSSAGFQHLFGGSKVVANALFYSDPRLAELVRQAAEQMSAGNQRMPNFAALLGPPPPAATGWRMVNGANGVLLSGIGTGVAGEQLLQGLPMQMVMMAGVAIPAMSQARTRAKNVSCQANLRQIEGAKQTWCIQENQPEDAVPTAADLGSYFTSGFASVRCPQGGTYTINAINQPATCSHPGHLLPAR